MTAMIAILMVMACGTPGPIDAPPAPLPVEAPASPAEVAPSTTPEPPLGVLPDNEPEPPPPAIEPAATPAIPAGFEPCHPEWRAGGCTREHKPACGVTADGRVSTAANACAACSDAATIGFKPGNCAE